MSRALVTLVGGVAVTLLAVGLLTPGASVATTGFALVGLTVLAGAAVMVVVARRARLRDELHDLERGTSVPGDPAPPASPRDGGGDTPDVTGPTEGTDRG